MAIGASGYIALVPGEAHAQHLLTLPFTHTYHAGIGNRAGIRSRFRAGQGKTRDLITARQTWQVMIFLLIGTVMLQQFAWAE